MAHSDDVKVLWQSLFQLMDSEESTESFSASVTGFGDATVMIDIAQPVTDIHKEFTSVTAAHDWLYDFSRGQHLELDPVCEFDFRSLVY